MLVFRVETKARVPYPCFEISQITEIEIGILSLFFTCSSLFDISINNENI